MKSKITATELLQAAGFIDPPGKAAGQLDSADAKRIAAGLIALAHEIDTARAVIEAADDWQSDRMPADWDSATLFKAINNHHGDWAGCEGCDHANCDEACTPATVAEQNASVDWHIADLVYMGKLGDEGDYTPPEGWAPSSYVKKAQKVRP